jgi:hypothetical protein
MGHLMFKEKDLEFLCQSLDVDLNLINKKRTYTLIASFIISIILYFYSKKVYLSIFVIASLNKKHQLHNYHSLVSLVIF